MYATMRIMATRSVGPLAFRASLTPDSVNEEKRTVDVVWTTGARVLRNSWEGAYFEELSLDPKHVRMGRLQNGAPFLDNHRGGDLGAVIGVVESASLQKSKGVATIRFAKDDARADEIWNKVKQGIIQNISVGYRTFRAEKVADGDTTTPVFRATDWEPYEISAVPMGADDNAGFRNAPEVNQCVFINRSNDVENEGNNGAPVATAPVVDVDAVRAEAIKTERERVAGIQAACRAAKLPELADGLVADGASVDAARAKVLTELAARSEALPKTENHVRVEMVDDNRDKFIRGASAALFERSGNGVVAEAKRQGVKGFEKIELDPGEFRGISVLDLARESLRRHGVQTQSLWNREEIIRRALSFRSGYATTSDFAVLLENVMNKSMRAAYAIQPDSWRLWCGTDTVSDFRDAHRFLNGSFGELDVVNEAGEYTNLAIPDGEKVSINTETRGKIIAITRQMLINDDLGAMTDLATRFGRGASRSIEKAVYAFLGLNTGLGPTMSDSQPFFHANRSNVASSAALSASALDADKVKMRLQTDVSGNDFIEQMPRIILVPVGLESSVKVLNTDAYDPAQVGQKSNVARGMFSTIVSSPYVSWSTTRRYLFTEAKEAFKVVFLAESGEGPTLESQNGWRVDGVEWKARLDFKVNAYDPKTAVTNAGT